MSSKRTFTPGPWAIDWNISRLDIHDANGKLIATLRRSTKDGAPTCDDAEAKANARLIAAAPQLLEALTVAVDVAQHEDGCRWFEVPLHRMSSEEGRADADARCNCWKKRARTALAAAGAQQ